jgi:WxcM-like, C-terminal
MRKSSIDDCSVIQLSKIHNRAGNITIVEGNKDVPFQIIRIYYLYDVPGGVERGGHGHKKLYQLIVATSGSFEVLLDDGKNNKTVRLYQPNYGLLVVPGIWRELFEFSSGSVCLVLASTEYDESDYIRDYSEYKLFKENDTSNR